MELFAIGMGDAVDPSFSTMDSDGVILPLGGGGPFMEGVTMVASSMKSPFPSLASLGEMFSSSSFAMEVSWRFDRSKMREDRRVLGVAVRIGASGTILILLGFFARFNLPNLLSNGRWQSLIDISLFLWHH